MKELQILSLLLISGAAVLTDLWKGKIPNAIIATGLLWGFVYQFWENGPAGLLLFTGGVLLPLFIFGGFYYFRMIGAGDVKLLCAVGGFVGPSACLTCMTAAVLTGGVISVLLMVRHRNFAHRMLWFAGYINTYTREMKWKPYLEDAPQEVRFCFALPVFLGVLYYIGGII